MIKKIDDINKLLLLSSMHPCAQKNKAINIAHYMNTPQSKAPSLANAKKIRPIKGVIIDAFKETPDTWTLDIFVSEKDKDYAAGQFISISPHQFSELTDFIKYFEHVKNKKETVRAYSLTSAPADKYISITIKPESYVPMQGALPPLLSPFLASDILVGREIEFLGYAGAYVIPEELKDSTDHVVHIVAGSGVVPSFSILKDELLERKTKARHSLVFVNKKEEDIIFHEHFKKLLKLFPEQLKIYYFLTQDPDAARLGENYYSGRPELEHIKKIIINPEKSLVFACGPALTKWQKKQALLSQCEPKPRFMEWVQEVIAAIGIDKKRYKREIYG